MPINSTASPTNQAPDMKLFWGCFIALITTSFGFIERVLTAGEWSAEFGLSETQTGEILGAGLWPFAISIILFSLIIDRVGYKVAMYFGLACHLVSTVLIITANSYWGMYLGTFILSLASGMVEAYINPVVATMFNKNKTKWLNVLHAGWPGGLVIGGILAILLGAGVGWRIKIGLILIPMAVYAFILFNKKFPVQERVLAGVSYKDMLKEVGAIGALIISLLMFSEIGRVFGFGSTVVYVLAALVAAGFGAYTKSLGRPLFIIMLLIMMPLASTELGVDSWITSLMAGEMEKIGINAGWVLVYTSFIMMVLRFYAGPIVHKISPLGLLAVSAFLAACGLLFLSKATGMTILLAATLYGVGKSFFWPTTLGVVAEQFPRGGALTLNTIAAVGMLAVGIVGAPLLGNFQDQYVDRKIKTYNQELHAQIMEENSGILGKYMSIDQSKLNGLDETARSEIAAIQQGAQKGTLSTVAYLPIFMLLCYIGLIIYFRLRGGYRPEEIG
ncbi:MAG TPA: MFS transporter [Bacteroidetes bacterium]|nr:MFS transporter [Bacteroidota bacterium]